MNIKKILTGVVSLGLVAAISVGGTLAYLTAKDSKTNVFTVGKIGLELTENKWVKYSKLIPGTTIPKNPTVTITKGSEDCYVRVIMNVPPELAKVIEEPKLASNEWEVTKKPANYQEGGEYIFEYKDVVNTSDKDFVSTLFNGIKVDELAPQELFNSLNDEMNRSLIIEAQAVQSANMTGGTTAEKRANAWQSFGKQLAYNTQHNIH